MTNRETEVRALLARLEERWQLGDAEGFAELFTEDADYVVFDGTRLTGRAAIADAHRPLFERFMKGSRLLVESADVRFLTDDVAVMCTRGAIAKPSESTPSPRRRSIQTLVAVRRDAGWSFASFQNTRERPFAKTLLGRVLLRLAPGGPWSVLAGGRRASARAA